MKEYDVAMRISIDDDHLIPSLSSDPRKWDHVALEKAVRLRAAYIERVLDVQNVVETDA